MLVICRSVTKLKGKMRKSASRAAPKISCRDRVLSGAKPLCPGGNLEPNLNRRYESSEMCASNIAYLCWPLYMHNLTRHVVFLHTLNKNTPSRSARGSQASTGQVSSVVREDTRSPDEEGFLHSLFFFSTEFLVFYDLELLFYE